MRQVILVLTGILLLTGCTTVVDSVTSEAHRNRSSRAPVLGTYYNDRKMATFIGVNIKKAHPDLDASHI